jgi:3-oxoacyl-(acyl-carrier-protein) synthase
VANAPASQLGILEKLGGANVTFAEKQAGGVRAVIEAARTLLHGRADAVLACGVDEADWVTAEGYDRVGALRTPDRPGMVLGEGAAVLAMARDPGPSPLAVLAGWGSAGAPAPPHRYAEDPAALVLACRQALERASIHPADVDLVVSLANGIPALAALELGALRAVFGGHRPASFPVADHLGEGAFSGTLRALIAAHALAGAPIGWPVPEHLAGVGFHALSGKPRTALVPGTAGGGSAVALVLTAA